MGGGSCSITLYLTAPRQGLSLKLRIGWWPVSPRDPPVSGIPNSGVTGSATPSFSCRCQGFELRSLHPCSKCSYLLGYSPSPRTSIFKIYSCIPLLESQTSHSRQALYHRAPCNPNNPHFLVKPQAGFHTQPSFRDSHCPLTDARDSLVMAVFHLWG